MIRFLLILAVTTGLPALAVLVAPPVMRAAAGLHGRRRSARRVGARVRLLRILFAVPLWRRARRVRLEHARPAQIMAAGTVSVATTTTRDEWEIRRREERLAARRAELMAWRDEAVAAAVAAPLRELDYLRDRDGKRTRRRAGGSTAHDLDRDGGVRVTTQVANREERDRELRDGYPGPATLETFAVNMRRLGSIPGSYYSPGGATDTDAEILKRRWRELHLDGEPMVLSRADLDRSSRSICPIDGTQMIEVTDMGSAHPSYICRSCSSSFLYR